MSNGTSIASKSSPHESETDTCQPPRSSLTCVSSFSPVQPSSIEELRTWLAQAFPASRFQSQESKPEPTTSETCGLQPGTLFAWYDPHSHGLKMSQGFLPLDIAEPSSETWPRWGSMRSGACFQLPELAPLIDASGFSLLPTIGANEFRGTSSVRYRGSTDFRGAKMAEGIRTGPNDPAYLNPLFGEWAMGFPMGWSGLNPVETDKYQQWLDAHGSA